MRSLKFLLIVFTGFTLQACASANHAQQGQEQGMERVYKASFDDTWDASVAAITSTEGNIVEQDKVKGSVVAEYGVGEFSWNDRVRISVKPLSARKTTVVVLSKRDAGFNATASNLENQLLARIGQNLHAKK